MRKTRTWIVVTGFLFTAMSIIACKGNSPTEKEEQTVMTSEMEYETTLNPKTETTAIETTENVGITGDLYTDARNGMLYMSISDGVIVTANASFYPLKRH